jgi:hypothetical protein
MATLAATRSVPTATSLSYDRFAGVCAILAGAVGFLYSVSFVVLRDARLYSLFLLLGGLLTIAVMVAVYERLREVDGSFALLALVLGALGGIGSAVHGGYDLSNALHPPAQVPDLPSGVDPRGFLTFGVAGLAVFIVAWLMTKSDFPKALGYLGYLSAVLLVVLYLARLIVLDATSLLILGPALLAGFIVNPIWYVWLGLQLRRR